MRLFLPTAWCSEFFVDFILDELICVKEIFEWGGKCDLNDLIVAFRICPWETECVVWMMFITISTCSFLLIGANPHDIIGFMGLIQSAILITIHGSILLVVVIKGVCILEILILFSGLSFAAIALFPEGEVEIVAVKANPVSLSCLIVGLAHLIVWTLLRVLHRCGVVVFHLWSLWNNRVYWMLLLYI